MRELFYQQFENIVQQVPETKIAVIFKDQQLTYSELNKKVNQLAHYLQGLHLESETRIGIFMEPSPDVVISVLAIMKAGLAFVPLSVGTDVGGSRLKYCIDDSKLKIILTHKKMRQHNIFSELNHSAIKLLNLDEIDSELKQQASANPEIKIAVSQLAYVIYSSGSTGKPKGILIEHNGLINCMVAHHQVMEVTEVDRIAQYAPLEFDASIMEIMMALGVGASLVIVPQEIRLNWSALSKYYQSDSTYVTVSILTPSILKKLKLEELTKLRIVISTGEKLEADLLNKLLKVIKLINGYGPSEATICTTLGICDTEVGVHIGQNAIQGLELFILEPDYDFTKGSSPKPVIEGEIYIAGAGLARGYTDEKLSQQRFREIQHPFNSEKTIRVFQTRDLAKRNQQNYLELLGRLDRQVKVYGKLICPEEIEELLCQQPNVAHAFVDIQLNNSGHPEKTAYIVSQPQIGNVNITDNNNEVSNDQSEKQVVDLFIYETIKQKLTQTMMPTRWVYLSNNAENIKKIIVNGKLNGKELIKLTEHEKKYYIREIDRLTQLDEIEGKLITLWEEELQLKKLDRDFQYQIDDNFLYLGGTSIQYANLVENIKYTFNIKLDIQSFLLNPTIASVARRIRRLQTTNKISPLIELHSKYPLRIHSPTESTPLFLIHTLLGDPQNDYTKAFLDAWIKSSNGRAVYGIKARGLENSKDMDTSLQEIAADYLEAIQKIQPQGPYLLGGWSAGVWIIREIAAQLQASGEQVAFFGIDSTAVTVFKTMSIHDYANYLFDLEEKAIRPRINSSPLTETDKKIIQQQQSKLKLLNEFFNRVRQHASSKEINERLLTTQFSLLKAGLTYQSDSTLLPCMTLIAATETQKIRGEKLGWSQSDGIETIKSQEGDHFNIMLAPRVNYIVSELIIFCQQKEAHFKLLALKDHLQQQYTNQENAYIHRLFSSKTSITENFVNVAIVNEEQQRKTEKAVFASEQENRQEILSLQRNTFDLRQKIPVSIPNLFQKRDRKRPRVLQIFGGPGSGKTTLCQYIAFSWARNQLWAADFALVIWIRLRRLTSERYPKNLKCELSTLIDMECLDRSGSKKEIHLEQLKQYINVIPDKVLLLLDGYDELDLNSPASQTIHDLLNNDHLHMIITSRPSFVIERQFDLTLEIIGFDQENIEQYIRAFFVKETEKANKLIEFIRKNAIQGMAHTPLLLELICTWWDDISNDSKAEIFSISWTALWKHLVNKLWQRYDVKQVNTISEYQSKIEIGARKLTVKAKYKAKEFINLFAFEGLRDKKTLFKETFINNLYEKNRDNFWTFDVDVELLIDVIQKLDIFNTPDKKHGAKEYYFIHYTLQEYLAAEHWVECFVVNKNKITFAENFLRENKYNPRYELFWTFVAGLLAEKDKTVVENFYYKMLSSPRAIAGFYELQLLLRCAIESENAVDEELKKDLLKLFGEYLEMALDSEQIIKFNRNFIKFRNQLFDYLKITPSLLQYKTIEDIFRKNLQSENNKIVSITVQALGHIRYVTSDLFNLLQQIIENYITAKSQVVDAKFEAIINSLAEFDNVDSVEIAKILIKIFKKFNHGDLALRLKNFLELILQRHPNFIELFGDDIKGYGNLPLAIISNKPLVDMANALLGKVQLSPYACTIRELHAVLKQLRHLASLIVDDWITPKVIEILLKGLNNSWHHTREYALEGILGFGTHPVLLSTLFEMSKSSPVIYRELPVLDYRTMADRTTAARVLTLISDKVDTAIINGLFELVEEQIKLYTSLPEDRIQFYSDQYGCGNGEWERQELKEYALTDIADILYASIDTLDKIDCDKDKLFTILLDLLNNKHLLGTLNKEKIKSVIINTINKAKNFDKDKYINCLINRVQKNENNVGVLVEILCIIECNEYPKLSKKIQQLIIDGLQDNISEDIQSSVAKAAGSLKNITLSLVQHLINKLKIGSAVQKALLFSLVELARINKDIIIANLISALENHPEESVKIASTEALGRIKVNTSEIKAVLIASRKVDGSLKQNASLALLKLGEVEYVISGLNNSNYLIQNLALTAIHQFCLNDPQFFTYSDKITQAILDLLNSKETQQHIQILSLLILENISIKYILQYCSSLIIVPAIMIDLIFFKLIGGEAIACYEQNKIWLRKDNQIILYEMNDHDMVNQINNKIKTSLVLKLREKVEESLAMEISSVKLSENNKFWLTVPSDNANKRKLEIDQLENNEPPEKQNKTNQDDATMENSM